MCRGALARVTGLRRRPAACGGNVTAVSTRPAVAVFGSSRIDLGSPAWAEAVRCGALLAARGFAVVTGGYGGAMEAVSQGASATGGHVIGVTAPAVFPGRSGANHHVTVERPAETLTERIHDMLSITDGAIALPGSIGTFTELMVAWNVAFVADLANRRPPLVVAVGSDWRRLVELVATSLDTNGKLVTCVDDVDEAVEAVARSVAG